MSVEQSVSVLTEFVHSNKNLVVITGAGCSAPSGIPTYRNEEAEWQRSAPIQHQDFVTRADSRKRYWARSFAGWPAVRDAEPNAAHRALAALESKGHISLLVTQNVDRLHQKAGHTDVIDLHGRLDQVICLDCRTLFERENVQSEITRLNPDRVVTRTTITPDGDADIEEDTSDLVVPSCDHCGGILKPDVVFFGGSVDKQIVRKIYQVVDEASAVLVIGSSLMVFSGYRFCRAAAAANKPIAIINNGKTRADELATMKIGLQCEELLPALVASLG